MNLFIFRRDFRINDNTALSFALQNNAHQIALAFFYQADQKRQYFSPRAFAFLNQCLKNLATKYHINVFEAPDDQAILSAIHAQQPLTAVYTNRDITDFAINRDQKIKMWCQKHNVKFRHGEDYLMFNPQHLLTKNHQPLQVFKPFYDQVMARRDEVQVKPLHLEQKACVKLAPNQFSVPIKPGNASGMMITRRQIFTAIKSTISQAFATNRDYFTFTTSHISAALKFGVISCREAFCYALAQPPRHGLPFVRQLLWKEFYYHYYFHHRNQYVIRGSCPTNINARYNEWVYDHNPVWVKKWKNGQTGIPLIDAAMQQLKQTGYMHNRARMVVATFFCKNMNLDWRIGERYFAQQLIDYDPIVNNQSWQWCGVTGLDFRGGYRVFSPAIQQQKFDPDGVYVQRFIPNGNRLASVDFRQSRQQFLDRHKSYLHNHPRLSIDET